MYSFWVGLFGTGLWIIAHECGHQAFSESKALNNTVGWVLHSAYVFFFMRGGGIKLTLRQTRGSVPFLEDQPWEASRVDGACCVGPGVRAADAFRGWFEAV